MLFLDREVGGRIDVRHAETGDLFMLWVERVAVNGDGEPVVRLSFADSLRNFEFQRHDRRKPDAKEIA